MLEGGGNVAEAGQAQAERPALRRQFAGRSGSDARDVQATLAGSPDAFEALVQRYEREVGAWMWRFSRDLRVRGELVQDVFVEAYLSLRTYRPDRPFLNWLRRIAVRTGYRHWEQRERQGRQLAVEAAPPAPSAAASLPEAGRAAELLHSLLARLHAEDRLVLTLMYFDDCDLREVAERTGWNRAMVAMRAYRARRRLKKIIEGGKLLEELRWLR
jgi:RNA polymerase sigma-70 factor, ECF subfamily